MPYHALANEIPSMLKSLGTMQFDISKRLICIKKIMWSRLIHVP